MEGWEFRKKGKKLLMAALFEFLNKGHKPLLDVAQALVADLTELLEEYEGVLDGETDLQSSD